MSNHKPATYIWTHREYFKKFGLNIEQYGEILTAQLFNGEKRGDSQPCYDIEASAIYAKEKLIKSGNSSEIVERLFSNLTDDKILIEVKSKLAKTQSGVASVIHCSENKINGVERIKKKHLSATHFVVIIFDGEKEGVAKNAWLFSNETARSLRNPNAKTKYISVFSLRHAYQKESHTIINITHLIEEVASMPFSIAKNE